MCLYVDHAEVIEKPIKTYVVRKIYNNDMNHIYSPYYYSKWEIGEMKCTYKYSSHETVDDFKKGFEINGDYFHSLEKLSDAQFIAEYLLTRRNTCGDIYAVFEAEISPSLIVCGDFELNYNKVFKSIASSNLTLVRKIGE